MQNIFITNDEFEGVELVCNRSAVASFYLQGHGAEIGALHKPLLINNDRASVRYIDYKSRRENYERYPELINEDIVHTDIIDDGFTLTSIPDKSLDFIIGNHILEHSPDPLGTLGVWLNRVKPSGILYVTVPIAAKCYDAGRPVTTLQHLIDDHNSFVSRNKSAVLRATKNHIREFISVSGNNIRVMNNMEPVSEEQKEKLFNKLLKGLRPAIDEAKNYNQLINAHIVFVNRVYDIHYHVFTPSSYENMLQFFCESNKATLDNVIKNGNGECIGIIRKD